MAPIATHRTASPARLSWLARDGGSRRRATGAHTASSTRPRSRRLPASLTGPDHLLAMVAVGLWAGVNGGRAVWAWPVAFVSVMLVGGALGMTGIALPMVEPGILASVIVLGLLVLTAPGCRSRSAPRWSRVRRPARLRARRRVAGAAAVSYSAGFALATALLHGGPRHRLPVAPRGRAPAGARRRRPGRRVRRRPRGD